MQGKERDGRASSAGDRSECPLGFPGVISGCLLQRDCKGFIEPPHPYVYGPRCCRCTILTFNYQYRCGDRLVILGTTVTSYCPHFPQDFSSGEPPQHHMLATKSNYAVIHGFGRIVFQSYGMIEMQGTNLVLEVGGAHKCRCHF